LQFLRGLRPNEQIVAGQLQRCSFPRLLAATLLRIVVTGGRCQLCQHLMSRSPKNLINLPGWCWAEIQQFALVGSSSSLHSEACNALGASDGVIHSRISQEVVCLRATTNVCFSWGSSNRRPPVDSSCCFLAASLAVTFAEAGSLDWNLSVFSRICITTRACSLRLVSSSSCVRVGKGACSRFRAFMCVCLYLFKLTQHEAPSAKALLQVRGAASCVVYLIRHEAPSAKALLQVRGAA
jgi:hypothetical protein